MAAKNEGWLAMELDGPVPGSAALHLVSGVALLRPEEQVFAAMLEGWRNQQLARDLAFFTIERRENMVKSFAAATNAFRGTGRRRCWTNGSVTAARSGTSSARRCAPTRTRPARSAGSPPIRPTAGRSSASSGSARTRYRSCTSGTRRVVALLVLLYAQPVSRIVRLTVHDVLRDDGQVAIRFGDPPSPVPEPFATLLLRFIDTRLNTSTPANQASPWLIPGKNAGEPMTAARVRKRLRASGIPTHQARAAAFRQLVLGRV
jgi:hypothetical protein